MSRMKQEDKPGLTPKQKIFCEEYVVDWNATRAAIAAGYSENSAKVIGHENLTKPYIADYIQEIQKDISKLAGVSALSNIQNLIKIRDNKKEKASDRIKSIEVINKMLGYDSPDKIDLTTQGEKVNNTPTIVFKKIDE